MASAVGLEVQREGGLAAGNVNVSEQPQLVIGGKVLSNGEDWTSYGPAESGIAYVLQYEPLCGTAT